eukprot:877047-Lingulodinium_polyedra.AAC.1
MYRVGNLYEGLMDDVAAGAIYAFDRVFNGTAGPASECGSRTRVLAGMMVDLSGTFNPLDCAHCIARMGYSVPPVVKVAVLLKDGNGLPMLVKGLEMLSGPDPRWAAPPGNAAI